MTDYLRLSRLFQLADSALPIGAAAHSFGLETLTEEQTVRVADLEAFLHDYLHETGRLESYFCRVAYDLGAATASRDEVFKVAWLTLNDRLSGYKVARESRAAGAALGRRFVQLVLGLEDLPRLRLALQVGRETGRDMHHATAFGLVGGALGFDWETTGLAYLQQSVTAMVSAAQRLMPLGQTQASQILWRLKPTFIELLEILATSPDAEPPVFTPMLDMGGLRHPWLSTRLFIS